MEEPISVAIVDDHSLFRQGIMNLLGEDLRISILFDAKDGVDFQTKIKKYRAPDVVLMDVNMPRMDGYETTQWLKKNYANANVLALSMDDSEEIIIRMIRCGAGGYLLKTSSIDELLKGIVTIAKTGSYINDHLSARLVSNVRNAIKDEEANAGFLTGREKEFLSYCCSEKAYKEIAVEMGVSVNTLSNYREDLGNKLNISSRVGLVIYAIKNNIVKLEDLPDL